MLTEKPPAAEKNRRRTAELAKPKVATYVLEEVTSTVTTADYLAAAQVYPLISGSRPDLYRAFMCRVWEHTAAFGSAGLVHPDTHFNGDKEAALREAAYRRLRMHGDFVNAGNRYFPPPVGRSSHFGVHIYGENGEIDFEHLSWLFSVDALRLSGAHDGSGEAPGVKFGGDWDERPHRKRVVRVTPHTLSRWQRLSGEKATPVERARLLTPVSTAEDPAIDALAVYPLRLGQLEPQITGGFNETNARKAINGPGRDTQLIEHNKDLEDREDFQADSWDDIILKGPQLGVANPFFKQPSQGGGEVLGLNHVDLASDAVPESEYRQVADDGTYQGEQAKWLDHELLARMREDAVALFLTRSEIALSCGRYPSEVSDVEVDGQLIAKATRAYTEFYRLAWRERIAADTERGLYIALIPPGATHVHSVRSAALSDVRSTALMAGCWAALPTDYLLQTTGVGHLDVAQARRLPALDAAHPLASALLLRTLRLNCLTTAYADLWHDLYDPIWSAYEPWARTWEHMETELHAVAPNWQRDTPLRTEYARRAALVEIDALVAVWLGIDADTLIIMYRARFDIMQDFDSGTWFDSTERKIAGNRYTYGHGQTSDHWKAFEKYLAGQKDESLPDADKPRPRRLHRPLLQGEPRAGDARGPRLLPEASRRGRLRRSLGPGQAGGAQAVRPTLEAQGLKESLLQYLSTTYALTDEGARQALHQFLGDENTGMFRGPFLRLRTPFVQADGSWEKYLDWRRTDWVPYAHQAKAFERLSSAGGRTPQPTLVTTGTGSGKTESFLYPVLDHCARERRAGRTGVKAVFLYPMNALATDQAQRINDLLRDEHEALGKVRAGLYIGDRAATQYDRVYTRRSDMQISPPDILITNYKMLDLLLQRAQDAPCGRTQTSATWSSTSSTPTTAHRAPTSRCCCGGSPLP